MAQNLHLDAFSGRNETEAANDEDSLATWGLPAPGMASSGFHAPSFQNNPMSMPDANPDANPDTNRGAAPSETVSPVVHTVITAPTGLQWPSILELWGYRDLLRMMTSRGVALNYRQSFLGVAWAIVRPLTTMLIFSLIFGRLVGIELDHDVPYPIFVLAGLVIWNFFALSLSLASESVVANAHVITKVYFPRLILPLSSLGIALVDFMIQLGLLMAFMGIYQMPVSSSLIGLPLFVALAALTSFSVSVWLTSLNVRFRDVRHVVPFLVQIWMYVSPVIYPASLVPAEYRHWTFLNPMYGVVAGFRWSLLGTDPPNVGSLCYSFVGVFAVLVVGLIAFRRMELRFADFV